ncbi:ABC transporter ATP-binding protein [Seohaeicola saemankumensis]|uniref:ABC transporter ATP-binding protein n=1 Tax=Seohaeicola saemankumensis TaxID=481181 RepID=A0ABW3TET2_9RHOB
MLIEANAITRRYGQGDIAVTALDQVSFEIDAGEFVAIMGPSGSGKSTLMNLLGLLDRPTSGQLIFNGRDVGSLSHDQLAASRNRDIGFVFQGYNLLPRHSALENVEIPLIYSGVGRKHRLQRSRAALQAVGLSHRCDHGPTELSGGEQQRVAIARALVSNPALILADEPTGALDSRTGTEILDLFKRLHIAGRTVIMITHDENIARHAARIIKLKDGKVLSDTRAAPQCTDDAKPAPADKLSGAMPHALSKTQQ